MGIQLPTALPSRANTQAGARHPKWMVWDSIPGEKELQGEKGSAQAQTLSLSRVMVLSPPAPGREWCHLQGGDGGGTVPAREDPSHATEGDLEQEMCCRSCQGKMWWLEQVNH